MTQAVARLAGGESVCVFPEGTSTAGGEVLPFKASVFEAAAALGCEVQPVAVHYPGAKGRPSVAPFIGDDDFFSHLLRVLAEDEIVVELSFPPAFHGHGRHRSELSSAAWQAVSAALAARPRRLHDERVTPRHPRGVDSPVHIWSHAVTLWEDHRRRG